MVDKTELLARIAAYSSELADIEARKTEVYAARLAAFQEGQDADPKVTQSEIADAAGVTEGAVTIALRKARLARAV